MPINGFYLGGMPKGIGVLNSTFEYYILLKFDAVRVKTKQTQ